MSRRQPLFHVVHRSFLSFFPSFFSYLFFSFFLFFFISLPFFLKIAKKFMYVTNAHPDDRLNHGQTRYVSVDSAVSALPKPIPTNQCSLLTKTNPTNPMLSAGRNQPRRTNALCFAQNQPLRPSAHWSV